jgi:hypothetical protein
MVARSSLTACHQTNHLESLEKDTPAKEIEIALYCAAHARSENMRITLVATSTYRSKINGCCKELCQRFV